MSFVGSIVGTQGEQVEVAFDIDKSAAGGNRYGFAPATGNLMYCMPQKGTKTALYIGNGDEAQGIATGCIRTNGSTCEGTGSPEKKSFRSEHGKGMDLYPCLLYTSADATSERDKLSALTQRSFLVCAYGGLIEPISSGQEE